MIRRRVNISGISTAALVAALLAVETAAGGETRLTLGEAVTLARESSENALMSEERVRQAENARVRARAALIPMLVVGGTFTHYDKEIAVQGRVIQKQDAFAGAGSLVVDLFKGPAYPGIKRARIEAAAKRAQSAWDKNLIAFEAAEAYFSVLTADNLVAATERTRETAGELLDAVKARREAGEALGVDQTRAELEVVAAEEAWIRARNARENATDYLAFLIDRRPPLRLAPVEVHPIPERSADALTETALGNRMDLKAADRAAEAAETGVKEAWMDFLPTLTASGNYRLSQNTGWSGDIDTWNIIFSLDWILYDGGLRQAKARDQSSARRTARLVERLLKRKVGLEVRKALRDLSTADATLKTALEKQRLAEINQEAVRDRYKAGIATSLEVVQADDDFQQAEVGAILVALKLSLSRLDLLRSLGLDPMGKEVSP
jgi:outer membrane protein TolC